MATNTKPTIDEILLDQGLDHILNSPDEEFVKFVRDSDMDMNELINVNKSAAIAALKIHDNKQTSDAIMYRPSKILKDKDENISYLERLIASAKTLGFSMNISIKDLENLSEESLQLQIAYFQSFLNKHGKSKRK